MWSQEKSSEASQAQLDSAKRSEIFEKFSLVDARGHTLLTPMVISREKKTLYLHIAKTGGSSIARELQNKGLDDGILTNKKLSIEKKCDYFAEVCSDWNNYFKFTFVRNKYAQLVSLYHYDKNGGAIDDIDFGEFIEKIVFPSEDQYGYWIDQYFLTISQGKSIFNAVGHTESHSDDLDKIFKEIGIASTGIRANTGRYDRARPLASYYSERSLQLVGQKFRDEIEFFGWSLE